MSSLAAGGPLLHLYDRRSHQIFLVDTGAEKSVLPHQSSKPPLGPHLISANGAAIPAWGAQSITVQFGDDVYRTVFHSFSLLYLFPSLVRTFWLITAS